LFLFFNAQSQNDSLVRIAFVGNSITYGYGLDHPRTESYPMQVGAILKEKYGDTCVIGNFGNSGRTMLKKGDLPLWVEKEYANAITFRPHIVVILLGTNDSKPQNWDSYSSEFYGDYKTMVDTFAKINPNAIIYACFPPKAFASTWDINDSVIKNGVIPEIDKVIANTNANLIDFYTPLQDSVNLFFDKIHPSLEGAKVMGKIVAAKLEEDDVIHKVNYTQNFITSFTTDLSQVHYKDTFMLSWKTIYADSVYLNNEKVDAQGSVKLTQKESSDYVLVSYGKTFNDTIVVPIEYYNPSIEKIYISAESKKIDVHSSTTLSLNLYDQYSRRIDTVAEIKWSVDKAEGIIETMEGNLVKFTPNASGEFSITATHGDINKRITIEALPNSSMPKKIKGLVVASNPFQNKLTFSTEDKSKIIESLQITNLSGNTFIKMKGNTNTIKLDTHNLESGVYFYTIVIDGETYTGEVIKE